MKLDSVRELKSQAIESVLKPMVAAGPRALGLAFSAAPLVQTEARTRLFAVGIAPRTRGDYLLAIRLQRRALLDHPSVNRLIKKAKGEVDVQFVGRIHKRTIFQDRTRPLVTGISVGHFKITAGTLGGFVKDRQTGKIMILSNNHVLANENKGKAGDAILQPGALDEGRNPQDRCATLTKFVRLRKGVANHVDSAVAAVLDEKNLDVKKFRAGGSLKGLRKAAVDAGLAVMKVGRTTGVTKGRVTAFELDDVTVGYDIGNVSFDDQIEIEGVGNQAFSDGGDSGSLIVDSAGLAVAQLFAGTDSGGKNGLGLTYASPIRAVLDSLDVDLLF